MVEYWSPDPEVQGSNPWRVQSSDPWGIGRWGLAASPSPWHMKKKRACGIGGGRDGGSVVEYWSPDPEVQGSNPWRVQGSNPWGTGRWGLAALPSARAWAPLQGGTGPNILTFCGRMAGSVVEYWSPDPEVQGSNPWRVQGSNPWCTGRWGLAAFPSPWHRI